MRSLLDYSCTAFMCCVENTILTPSDHCLVPCRAAVHTKKTTTTTLLLLAGRNCFPSWIQNEVQTVVRKCDAKTRLHTSSDKACSRFKNKDNQDMHAARASPCKDTDSRCWRKKYIGVDSKLGGETLTGSPVLGGQSWITCPTSSVLRPLFWVTCPGSPVLGHLS